MECNIYFRMHTLECSTSPSRKMMHSTGCDPWTRRCSPLKHTQNRCCTINHSLYYPHSNDEYCTPMCEYCTHYVPPLVTPNSDEFLTFLRLPNVKNFILFLKFYFLRISDISDLSESLIDSHFG